MENSESLHMADMNFDDVNDGLLLSDEANWNQTDDDWRLFIRCGKTIGLRNQDGRLIATAAALPYESTFGFVAMVLVTEKWRRRGLATRLVDHCIEWLHGQQLVAVLDATEDGAKVYRRQGFVPLFELDRWRLGASINRLAGNTKGNGKAKPSEQKIDLKIVTNLDAEAVGARREFLTRDFFGRSGTQIFLSPDETGFAFFRHGRQALQIGPVVGRSQNDAIDLISRALEDTTAPILIDVPKKARQVGLWLKNYGFTVQRSFTRMALSHARPFGVTARLYSSAGPEFG